MKSNLVSFVVFAGLFTMSQTAFAQGQTVQGYTIDQCRPAESYDAEGVIEDRNRDFCTTNAIKFYQKYKAKDINFAKKYVLVNMYGDSFVALDPVKKRVFVMPYVVSDLYTDGKVGKLSFSKAKNVVCTAGNAVGFSPYTSLLTAGESTPGYKLCLDFMPNKGFDDQYYVVHKKTGKIIPRL